MIFFTGDTHGGYDVSKLSSKKWKEQKNLTKSDYLIVAGDFGLPFLDSETEENGKGRGEYKYWCEWFSEKPYTLLWADGNHDNFNFWDRQPVINMFGGKVQPHPDIKGCMHLMRGEVYEIDGRRIFTFGGAASHDREQRTENIDWWAREQASDEEIGNARRNLERVNGSVDAVVTHTLPVSIANQLYRPEKDRTAEFLETLLYGLDYKFWVCGHFHRDMYIRAHRINVMYNTVASYEEILGMNKL